MREGICPKCGSNEIYKNKKLQPLNSLLLKFAWGWIRAYMNRYVCASCGYTEAYIEDETSMQNIIKVFEPLNKEKRKNEDY
jgi:predicted nucleic-acid-binding Zn-ribbon protein